MPKVRQGTSDSEILTRFWSKVQIGDGCWLWTASTIKGYGQFRLPRINGKQQTPQYAHRFAWQITNGPIPKGLNVCHHCDTPLCVRPDHLFLGTQQENLDDARRKGRLVDGSGRQRKLSDQDYLDILTSRETLVSLANRFGVHEQSIWRIRNGVQGVASINRILERQPSQSQPGPASTRVKQQVLEPVPFVHLPVVGEVR